MSDTWQTIPVKHRKWVPTSNPNPAPNPTNPTNPSTVPKANPAFASTAKQRPAFSSFGSRTSKDNSSNRIIPDAFSSKRGDTDSRKDRNEQRKMLQAQLELEELRIRNNEENTLKEALTIESEKEYPSLMSSHASPSSAGSPKKSSNSLNFKAVVESPASQNVPKLTVIGGAKPARPTTPHVYQYEEEEKDEYEEEEFNAHIGSRRRGDAW